MKRYRELIANMRQVPLDLPLGNGFRVACWSGPTSFDAESKAAIYEAIIEMASVVFGDDMTFYWRKRAEEGYLDTISRLFILYDEDGELVGWSGYHRMRTADQCALYADATGVLPRVRRFGLIRKLMTWSFIEELVRNGLRPVYWTMRTESPVVYCAFRSSFGEANVYPRPEADPPQVVREIGVATARWLRQDDKLCPRSLRIEDAFDGPCPWRFTAEKKPLPGGHIESSSEKINDFVRQTLRPEDAFLIVARCSITSLVWLSLLGLRAQIRPLYKRLRALLDVRMPSAAS